MANFIPTNLTNQELFEMVYTFKEFFLEDHHDYTYICDTNGKVVVCLCHQKGNNELGLFLDCLHCAIVTNPTAEQTVALANVFFLAKNYALHGHLHKDSDLLRAVNAYRDDDADNADKTTFSQQCCIFAYVQDIIDEKMSIVQQDDGKLALDKKIIFIEPQSYEIKYFR